MSKTVIILAFIGLMGQQRAQPYQEEGINLIYELLFADDLKLYESNTENKEQYPFNLIFGAPNDDQMIELINSDLATRVKVLAHRKLQKSLNSEELLGVIVEVSMLEGLDVLAAYKDGTARYINYSEKLLVWETQTEESDKLIDQLFKSGVNALQKLDISEQQRQVFPRKGNVRLTFLVCDQLYVFEVGMGSMYDDVASGQLFQDASMMMNYLISTALGDE